MSDLKEACKVVLAAGFTPVRSDGYARLRAWLDETNGWPPKDWQPPETEEPQGRHAEAPGE